MALAPELELRTEKSGSDGGGVGDVGGGEKNGSDGGGRLSKLGNCPVECGSSMKDSPTLLFLPGLDGLGLGLILHHKPLGKAFEVMCLHIPVHDRTSFEGLVKLFGRRFLWRMPSSCCCCS
ncbi:hypothetical protein LWI29_007352 [Acer saccharum]|uniref:Uncharacterized protein n=1 Tax=Acer saccharum TaxID=4024 RepID=A0AA39S137_ACESA|nr:hypothetical protein LWI29_007352 [Acer saccharum]